MKIHQRTFYEFCTILRGYQIFNKQGFEVTKWELFFRGVDPFVILDKKSDFIKKKIIHKPKKKR